MCITRVGAAPGHSPTQVRPTLPFSILAFSSLLFPSIPFSLISFSLLLSFSRPSVTTHFTSLPLYAFIPILPFLPSLVAFPRLPHLSSFSRLFHSVSLNSNPIHLIFFISCSHSLFQLIIDAYLGKQNSAILIKLTAFTLTNSQLTV